MSGHGLPWTGSCVNPVGVRCVVSRLTSVRKFPFLEFAPCSLIGDSSIRTFYALRELAHTPALGGHSLILIVPCFFAA